MKTKIKNPIQRIFVRSPNWVGDQILAYPFFDKLRLLYPEAWITAVCPPRTQDMQFRRCIDQVIVLPQNHSSSLKGRWNQFHESVQLLRQEAPWQWGLTLSPSFSSAALLWYLGIPRRRGYQTDGRRFLLNEGVPLDPKLHFAQAFFKLLGEEGGPFLLPPRPALEEVWDASAMWKPPCFPYWILAPGSNAEARRWPWESYLEVAKNIADKTGWTGLVVGGQSEKEWVQKTFLERSKEMKQANLQDWTGRGGVAQYGKIFQKAQFTLSNDSGLAHVAAFCGSPVQLVWGAGKPDRVSPHYSENVQICLGSSPPCWPCQKNQCRYTDSRQNECLLSIRPQQVWASLQSFF